MTTLVDLLRWAAAGKLGEADGDLLGEIVMAPGGNLYLDDLLAALREAFGEREAVLADLAEVLTRIRRHAEFHVFPAQRCKGCSAIDAAADAAIARAKAAR